MYIPSASREVVAPIAAGRSSAPQVSPASRGATGANEPSPNTARGVSLAIGNTA